MTPNGRKPREIETLDAFDAAVASPTGLRNQIVQSVDLTARGHELRRTQVKGAVFLGCRFDQATEDSVHTRGALVFPALPDLPFDSYRAGLYTAAELYDAADYPACTDARIYAWTLAQTDPPSLTATLATSLHDHAIGDALEEFCEDVDPHRTVGIMGGHACLRGDDTYIAAAGVAAALAEEGFTVVTGGGPGAMEAADLGARLPHDTASLTRAIAALRVMPDFHGDIGRWSQTALDVERDLPQKPRTLGVPTWFYGHEPPNVFATDIAKYFSNAIREDVLLNRCRGGVVYLPGAAGTVQEIFQAATANYYASQPGQVAPMVLVGRDYWQHQLPAWELLQQLGQGRPMADRIALVDSVADAATLLVSAE